MSASISDRDTNLYAWPSFSSSLGFREVTEQKHGKSSYTETLKANKTNVHRAGRPQPAGSSDLFPVSVNNVLLDHGHALPLMYGSWFLSR